MRWFKGLIKFWIVIFLVGSFIGCVAVSTGQERPLAMKGQKIQTGDLRVLQLEMFPDPIREGQRVRFHLTISNLSPHPGRVNLFIKDRDETIVEAHDILLQPGPNRINFPETGYRFGRHEHCFVVEVDIERTRRPVDVAKELCARRVNGSWTLSRLEAGIGPFLIESLDMRPDPVKPDQKVRFWVKLRNDGSPIRADIRIQNRGEIITQLTEVLIKEEYGEYLLPQTVFPFERFEPCFTVIVDSGRTPHRFDSKRDFCARAYGHPLKWTFKP